MRTVVVIALVLSSATVAYAQQTTSTAAVGLPLPPIGLPLPPIGLSAPELTTPPPPRRPGGKPQRPHVTPIVIFGPTYGWGLDPWQLSPTPGVIASPPSEPVMDLPNVAVGDSGRELGTLQLEIKPADAQLYVDGEFVGTWSDLAGQLELAPGTHRIEIRARRHEALAFDARITAGQTITYRGELTRVQEQPATATKPPSLTPPKNRPATQAPSKPARNQTFYLIPGCYLGNIPPDQVKLPAGCDLTRMITHTPQD
jgi:hypothetical protein